jgi:hypothetical protein
MVLPWVTEKCVILMLQLQQKLALKLHKTLAVIHSKVKKLARVVQNAANGTPLQKPAAKEIALPSWLHPAQIPDSF